MCRRTINKTYVLGEGIGAVGRGLFNGALCAILYV